MGIKSLFNTFLSNIFCCLEIEPYVSREGWGGGGGEMKSQSMCIEPENIIAFKYWKQNSK